MYVPHKQLGPLFVTLICIGYSFAWHIVVVVCFQKGVPLEQPKINL